MKTQQNANRAGGFSLLELMVVVGILILLSGMIIAALPGIQNKLNRQNVQAFLAEIESGLGQYQIDNGIYPINRLEGDRDSSGIVGAQKLYTYLSGDRDGDGEVDEDGEVYVQRLDYNRNQESKSPRVTIYQDAIVVVDSFNSPVRYLAPPANLSERDRIQAGYRNPTYDLWSIVDTDPGDESEAALSRHITNWGAN